MRTSLLLVLIAAAVLLSADSASAAINPIYRCTQRGYNLTGSNMSSDYCVFPDGSRCPLREFVNGTCGAQFTQACVGEGAYVWTGSGDRCCPGLSPYLAYPVGQPTCQSASLSGSPSPGAPESPSPRQPGFELPLALAALAAAGLFRRRRHR